MTLCAAFISAAQAAEVKVPDTAKQLKRDGIVAAYAGKSITWERVNGGQVTGTATFAADLKSATGTWKTSDQGGEWESKVTIKGDQYCYQARNKGEKKYGKVTCAIMFSDGTQFYEVEPKAKKLVSITKYQ
jgi:hypothetical protein